MAVTYGGDHVPKSPFSVAVAPTLDLSKISVAGLGDSAYTSARPDFSCLRAGKLLFLTETHLVLVKTRTLRGLLSPAPG